MPQHAALMHAHHIRRCRRRDHCANFSRRSQSCERNDRVDWLHRRGPGIPKGKVVHQVISISSPPDFYFGTQFGATNGQYVWGIFSEEFRVLSGRILPAFPSWSSPPHCIFIRRYRFFRVFFVPFPLSLCMKSTWYVLPFRMVFFLPCDHGLDFWHQLM